MAYEKIGAQSVDYSLWRCPGSRLMFRGPRRGLDRDFIAFLGGAETYGKFIERPFPSLIEERLGIACVNLGRPNAGVDVYLKEEAVLEICTRARAVVVQVPCAQNMSNRFYSVHPRRNDRFTGPTDLMRSTFPEMDFTEFHFTRHLLRRLQQAAPDRFHLLRDALHQLWIRRMRQLLRGVGGHATLLWFSARGPGEAGGDRALLTEPAFVTAQMLSAIAGEARSLVTVRISEDARQRGTEGMVFSEFEATAAAELPGPAAHREVARALCPVLRDHRA